MEASIIIVSFNTLELTRQAIRSVRKHTKGVSYELIVVDNNSSDGSREYLSKLNKQYNNFVLVKNSENLGFAKGNNKGIKIAQGKYVLLLNSDTKIYSNVVGEMIAELERGRNTGIGIASCKLKNSDGSVQGNGGYFPSLVRVFSWMTIQDLPLVDYIVKPFHPLKSKSYAKSEKFYDTERDLDWVSGAFFMIRSDVFGKIGRFDEKYFMYTEETDFCFRAKKAGYRVRYFPKWDIIHYGGASGSHESAIISEYKGVKRFYKKHYPSWQYPLLRLFLKIGALGRMIVLGILDGRKGLLIYARAFKEA